MKLDLDKPLQTRDGSSVRILCRYKKGPENARVIGLVTHCNGDESVFSWSIAGRYLITRESRYDLVNIPVKHTVWVNFEVSPFAYTHLSKAEAETSRNADCIATVEVTFTEGEGL